MTAGQNSAGLNRTGVNRTADQRADQAPARPGVLPSPPEVHIDCQGCTARPQACGDCVVTFLLGSPPEGVDLAPDEQEALDVLAASGLVPILRYRPTDAGASSPAHGS